MYDVVKNVGGKFVAVAVRSSATGRSFEVEEQVLSARRAAEEEVEPGVEGAERRAMAAVEKWRSDDARLAAVFDVSVKSLAVTLADVRAFSDADTQNLVSRLDVSRLERLALAHGIMEGAKDRGVRLAFDSGLDRASLPILKTIIVELMSRVEGLNLGSFLRDKGADGRDREAITMRVKSGLAAEIVDRDGQNVLLRDGTLIGEAFKSRKVRDFLKKYVDVMATSQSFAEIEAAKRKIEEIGAAIDRDERREMTRSYVSNPMFKDAVNSFDGRADVKSGADVEAAAMLHRLQGTSAGDRTEWLLGKIGDVVFDRFDDRGRWWDRTDDQLSAKARSMAVAYASAAGAVGDGGLVTGVEDEAARLVAGKLEVATFLRGLRGRVLAKLAEAGKPATERRVMRVVDEEIAASEPARAAGLYRWSLKGIFEDDIVAADKASLAEAAAKTARAKGKAASGGRFRFEAIKAPSTAFAKLVELWDSLDGAAASHLVGLLDGDARVQFEKWAAGDEARLSGLLAKGGEAAVSREWGVNFAGLLLRRAVLDGRDALVRWENLTGGVVQDLAPRVPDAFVLDALELLVQLVGGGGDKKAAAGLVDSTLARVDPRADQGILGEKLLAILRTMVRTGPVRVLWKHLKTWGKGVAKGSEFEGQYVEVFVAVAATLGAPEGDGPELDKKQRERLSPLLFAWAMKKGAFAEAGRHLKVVLSRPPRDRRDAGELLSDDDGVMTLVANRAIGVGDGSYISTRSFSIDSLMKSEEVSTIPEIAPILLDAAEERGLTEPCQLKTLVKIFKAAGVPAGRQDGLVVEFYGANSSEVVTFREERGTLDVDALAEQLSTALGAGGRARRSYSYDDPARLRDEHLRFFDVIVRKNPGFASSVNLSRLPPDVSSGLSPEALQIILPRVTREFSSATHASRLFGLGLLLSRFVAHEEFSTRVILETPDIKPRQAVECAKNLHPAAVKKCASRLVACVKGNKEALDELAKHLDVSALDGDEKRILSTTPMALAARAAGGDRSLSTAEWKKLFGDEKAFMRLVFDLAEAGNRRAIKQIALLSESFDVSPRGVFKAVSESSLDLLSSDDGAAVLSDILGVSETTAAFQATATDYFSGHRWGRERRADRENQEAFVAAIRRCAALLGDSGGRFIREVVVGVVDSTWDWHGDGESADVDLAARLCDAFSLVDAAGEKLRADVSEIMSDSRDLERISNVMKSIRKVAKKLGLPDSAVFTPDAMKILNSDGKAGGDK